jgi:hypothetical protein
MNLRRVLFLLALLFTPAIASAQVGIYGQFNAVHASTSGTNLYESTGWFVGPTAGVYYDFLHLGPVGIGADLRGSYLFQSPQKYRSILFGLRLAVKPPVLPLRPYIQGSVGVGGSTRSGLGGNGVLYNNKFQYQVVGGIDYTLVPHLDWRVAELGYGRSAGISSGGPTPGVNLFTISTGVVFRF